MFERGSYTLVPLKIDQAAQGALKDMIGKTLWPKFGEDVFSGVFRPSLGRLSLMT